jgi:hypothetical protein
MQVIKTLNIVPRCDCAVAAVVDVAAEPIECHIRSIALRGECARSSDLAHGKGRSPLAAASRQLRGTMLRKG